MTPGREGHFATPELLTFDKTTLVTATAGAVRAADYPDVWPQDGLELPVRYRFEPGARDDGVTVEIPLPVLGRVRPEPFAWQVPGLREELVVALIRSLPKPLRREFVPVPDFARAALAELSTPDGDPLDALERRLRRLAAVPVPREAWQPDRVPEHLRMSFQPTFCIDISDTIEQKMQAVACYASQFDRPTSGVYDKSLDVPAMLRTLTGYFGGRIGTAHAEPFSTQEVLGFAGLDQLV